MTSGAGEEVAGGREAGVGEGGGPLGASNLVQNTLNWYGRFGSLEVGGASSCSPWQIVGPSRPPWCSYPQPVVQS